MEDINKNKMAQLHTISKGSSRGVATKVLDYGCEVSVFELKSFCYVQFLKIKNLGKGMNFFIHLLAME